MPTAEEIRIATAAPTGGRTSPGPTDPLQNPHDN